MFSLNDLLSYCTRHFYISFIHTVYMDICTKLYEERIKQHADDNILLEEIHHFAMDQLFGYVRRVVVIRLMHFKLVVEVILSLLWTTKYF